MIIKKITKLTSENVKWLQAHGVNVEAKAVEESPEDADDPWAVEVQPGNYMAFFEPWDSGEYDT